MNLESQMKGALLGFSLGDAIGAPLEFMSMEQIQIKHGRVSSMIGGGWLGLRPGQYTDDTIMMMALCESLLENKKVVPEDVAKRYLAWYRTQPKDIGPTMRASLALLDDGLELSKIAAKAHEESDGKTNDNDTIARCIPLALLYFKDTDRLIEESLKEASITHYDKRAGSGSAALNLILTRIFAGERDKKKILSQVFTLLEDNTQGAYNILPDPSLKKIDELRPTSNVVDTLEVALWGWLKTSTFEDAIVTIINLGGDADTIAAVGGAIAGAYYGEEALPIEWLKFLQDKNIISQLGRRFFKAVGS